MLTSIDLEVGRSVGLKPALKKAEFPPGMKLMWPFPSSSPDACQEQGRSMLQQAGELLSQGKSPPPGSAPAGMNRRS